MDVNDSHPIVNASDTSVPDDQMSGNIRHKLKQPTYIIIGLVLMIIIGIGGYWLGKNTNNHTTSALTQAQPTHSIQTPTRLLSKDSLLTTTDLQSPQKILQSLQQSISTNAPIEIGDGDRTDDNNQHLPLKGWKFSLGIKEDDHGGGIWGDYGNFSKRSEITEASLQPLQSAAEGFFIKNGFTKFNKGRPDAFDIYYSYTLKDITCVVTLTPQQELFGDFFCGTIDYEQLALEKELAPAINPKNDPNVSFNVEKLTGNYAIGIKVSPLKSDEHFWAVRVNEQWKEVWTGQNSIPCNIKQQYNIPDEVAPACNNY